MLNSVKLDSFIAQSSNPEEVANKLGRLCEKHIASQCINELSSHNQHLLVKILDISDFLTRFLNCNPEAIAQIGAEPVFPQAISNIQDLAELRRFKYQTLLQITAMDLANSCPYETIFELLTRLADIVIASVHSVSVRELEKETGRNLDDEIAALALGKLGAREINYSSDIDLIFVSETECQQVQEDYFKHIRTFSRLMEMRTDDGFLYRVDLNLRPWGKSAPLILDIDATEQYYEASKEAWERFAWLRARAVAGKSTLADELLSRLRPFVFHRALGADDVERFIQIKSAMADARQQPGQWNIKTGEGGIRDVEFFVQLLQITNGAYIKDLRVTNTLKALEELSRHDLISTEDQEQLKDTYIFLRKLEHRVQMQDEQQTHALPDDKQKQSRIACSMGYDGDDVNEKFMRFNEDLLFHRQVAKQFFERVLNSDIEIE